MSFSKKSFEVKKALSAISTMVYTQLHGFILATEYSEELLHNENYFFD